MRANILLVFLMSQTHTKPSWQPTANLLEDWSQAQEKPASLVVPSTDRCSYVPLLVMA